MSYQDHKSLHYSSSIEEIKSKINMYDLFNHFGIDIVKDKIIRIFNKKYNKMLNINLD